MPAYWLIKSEPDTFSFADLQAVEHEPWNGIRNYQARNFLRQMAAGDLCLFYHSNARPPGIVGVARVVRPAYPDDLQFDPASEYYDPKSSAENPRWSMVDVAAAAPLPQVVTLDDLRQLPAWATSPLTQKGSRLSVMPVEPEQFAAALQAGRLSLERIGTELL